MNDREGATRGSRARPRPVVVAVDLREGSEAILRAAWGLTETTGAPILLVHVVRDLSDVFDPYLSSMPVDRLQSELALEGRAWLGRLRAECLGGDPRVREIVLAGTPWTAIVDTARRNQAETIVIGLSSPSAVERPRPVETLAIELGTTTERVVRHAPCSVMVVPVGFDEALDDATLGGEDSRT